MTIAVIQGSGGTVAGLEAVVVQKNGSGDLVRSAEKGYQTAGPNSGGKRAKAYGFFVPPQSSKAVVLKEEFPITNRCKPPSREERAGLPE